MEKQTLKNRTKIFTKRLAKKGGEATAKTHDHDHYEDIGEKGGKATAKNHDKDFYEEIGRKGGKN